MLCRQRGAEHGDGVVDAMLGQHHDVHVAFDHQQQVRVACLLQHVGQAVQFAALVKNGGFGRIEVFGLALADDASAESDHPPATILDREHHPPTKTVMAAAVFVTGQQAGLTQQVSTVPLAQRAAEAIPPVRRETEVKTRRGFAIQAAILEVLDRADCRRVMTQLLAVEGTGRGQHLVQRRQRGP